MYDYLESIVKYIITHRVIRELISSFVFASILLNVIITALYLYKINTFPSNLFSIYTKEPYLFIWKEYDIAIKVWAFVSFVLIFFSFVAWRFYTKLKKRNQFLNTMIQKDSIKIPLENIVELWFDEEEILDFKKARESVKTQLNNNEECIIHKDDLISGFISGLGKDDEISEIVIFAENIIYQNKTSLSLVEIKIIIKILGLLRNNIKTPSVIMKYSSDTNAIYKNEMITSEISQYQALATISLLTHSLSVAKKIIELLYADRKKISTRKANKLLGKCIIVALAHDIGKISKYNSLLGEANFKKQAERNSHEILSKVILQDLCINFVKNKDITYNEIKELSDIVASHHKDNIKEQDGIKFLLQQADRQTRADELEIFVQNIEFVEIKQGEIFFNYNKNKNDFIADKISKKEISKQESLTQTQIITESLSKEVPQNKQSNKKEAKAITKEIQNTTKTFYDYAVLVSDFIEYEKNNLNRKGLALIYIDNSIDKMQGTRNEQYIEKFIEILTSKENFTPYFADDEKDIGDIYILGRNIQSKEHFLLELKELYDKLKELNSSNKENSYVIYTYLEKSCDKFDTIIQSINIALEYAYKKSEYFLDIKHIRNNTSMISISDDDIASLSDFDTINKELQNTNLKKKYELEFPIDKYIDTIKQTIIDNIYKENSDEKILYNAVISKKLILVNRLFLESYFRLLFDDKNINHSKYRVNYFLAQINAMKMQENSKDFIYGINIEKGYYHKKYILHKLSSSAIDYFCIPFRMKFFNITDLLSYENRKNGVEIIIKDGFTQNDKG